MDHTIKVNAPAMTASAKPACAARADTAPSMSAPLVLELPFDAAAELVAEDPAPEAAEASDGTAVEGDRDADKEDDAVRGVAEVLFEGEPPGRYDGGGAALEGSVSAPLPQGIPWPSGWVRFGAATVVPVLSAMAKRPVQRRSVALPS